MTSKTEGEYVNDRARTVQGLIDILSKCDPNAQLIGKTLVGMISVVEQKSGAVLIVEHDQDFSTQQNLNVVK